MKKFYLIVALGTLLIGCAAINKAFNSVAPDQVNAVTNQEIVGTHALTPGATQIVNDAVPLAGPFSPFVMPIISLILLGVNFFQKAQNGKLNDAIVSTVQTVENAGNDPTLAPAIAILKTKLAASHQIVGVQPLVNDILSQLKMLPTSTPTVSPVVSTPTPPPVA